MWFTSLTKISFFLWPFPRLGLGLDHFWRTLRFGVGDLAINWRDFPTGRYAIGTQYKNIETKSLYVINALDFHGMQNQLMNWMFDRFFKKKQFKFCEFRCEIKTFSSRDCALSSRPAACANTTVVMSTASGSCLNIYTTVFLMKKKR